MHGHTDARVNGQNGKYFSGNKKEVKFKKIHDMLVYFFLFLVTFILILTNYNSVCEMLSPNKPGVKRNSLTYKNMWRSMQN